MAARFYSSSVCQETSIIPVLVVHYPAAPLYSDYIGLRILSKMSSLFCCDAIQPYRPQYLQHQDKFNSFMGWSAFPRAAAMDNDEKPDLAKLKPSFAVQLVRQVNYGPLEAKRYFIPIEGQANEFVEIGEDDLIQANFQKLNSYVCSAV